jgi:hypothetical protein
MATATQKSVFALIDDLAAEEIAVGVERDKHRARVAAIDVEITALTATIVRDSKADPAAVQKQIVVLEAEKATVTAKVAATPAAIAQIKFDAACLRDERKHEFVERADQWHADLVAAQEQFVDAAKALRDAWQVSASADRELGIGPRPPTSHRGLVNIGMAYSCGPLQHLDRTVEMWSDGGPRSISAR